MKKLLELFLHCVAINFRLQRYTISTETSVNRYTQKPHFFHFFANKAPHFFRFFPIKRLILRHFHRSKHTFP